MDHKRIVIAQLKAERAKLQTECDRLAAGILALGGDVDTGVSSIQKRRSRGRGAGKPRAASKPSKSAAVEALSPALAAQLVAIKSNPNLSPIQKAQASRKARLAARLAARAAAPPQGAVLSEATAG